MEVVNVEHEEVLLVPRWVKAKRVTFKYGLGEKFINVLKTLHMLGLDRKRRKSTSKRCGWRPAMWWQPACPTPPGWATAWKGKTCAGTWVRGIKDGKPREVYLYQVADNEQCMKEWGCQAVVAQTAFSAVIAMDLLEHGIWKGVGVLGPRSFPPEPFMAQAWPNTASPMPSVR